MLFYVSCYSQSVLFALGTASLFFVLARKPYTPSKMTKFSFQATYGSYMQADCTCMGNKQFRNGMV